MFWYKKPFSVTAKDSLPPSLSLNNNKKSPTWNATNATFMLNFRLTKIRLNPRQQQLIKVSHRYRTWIQDTELIISASQLVLALVSDLYLKSMNAEIWSFKQKFWRNNYLNFLSLQSGQLM